MKCSRWVPLTIVCCLMLSTSPAVGTASPAFARAQWMLYAAALGPTVYAIDIPSGTIVNEARLGDSYMARFGLTSAPLALFPVRQGDALCLVTVRGVATNGTRPAPVQTTELIFLDPGTLSVAASHKVENLEPHQWRTTADDYLILDGETTCDGQRRDITRVYRIGPKYDLSPASDIPEATAVTDWAACGRAYGSLVPAAPVTGDISVYVFAHDQERGVMYALAHRARLASDGHIESMGFDQAELWELDAATLDRRYVLSLAARNLGGYPLPFVSGSPLVPGGDHLVALFPGSGYLGHPAPTCLMIYDTTTHAVEYLQLESDACSPVLLSLEAPASTACPMRELRRVLDAWRGSLAWNETLHEASGTCRGLRFRVRLGEAFAWIDGQRIALPVPANLAQGRTWVPEGLVLELASRIATRTASQALEPL